MSPWPASARALVWLARAWPFVVAVALWQAWVTLAHVPSIVVPAPLAVVHELATHPELYAREGVATLGVACAGMAIGTVLSVALGAATWFSPFATAALAFPALFVQATPVVALMPLLARLFGYDRKTVVVATALIAFFPTFVLAASGLRASSRGADDLFRALGATRLARFRYLALPSAVPNLLAALRIAAANSVLAALVAEYLMGTAGLGRVFAIEESSFNVAGAWAACFVATVISVTAYFSALFIERALSPRFRT